MRNSDLNKSTALIRYVSGLSNLSSKTKLIFANWMLDKENFPTSPAILGKYLNILSNNVSRALSELTKKEILTKNGRFYYIHPNLLNKVNIQKTITSDSIEEILSDAKLSPVIVKVSPVIVSENDKSITSDTDTITSDSKNYHQRYTYREQVNNKEKNSYTSTNLPKTKNQESIENLIIKLQSDYDQNKTFSNRKNCLLIFFTAMKQNNYPPNELSTSDLNKIKAIFIPKKRPASMTKDKYESWDNMIDQDIESSKAYVYAQDMKSPKVKLPSEGEIYQQYLDSQGFIDISGQIDPDLKTRFEKYDVK